MVPATWRGWSRGSKYSLPSDQTPERGRSRGTFLMKTGVRNSPIRSLEWQKENQPRVLPVQLRNTLHMGHLLQGEMCPACPDMRARLVTLLAKEFAIRRGVLTCTAFRGCTASRRHRWLGSGVRKSYAAREVQKEVIGFGCCAPMGAAHRDGCSPPRYRSCPDLLSVTSREILAAKKKVQTAHKNMHGSKHAIGTGTFSRNVTFHCRKKGALQPLPSKNGTCENKT